MKKKRAIKASSLSVDYLTHNVILSHHLLTDALRDMKSQIAALRIELSALREELKPRPEFRGAVSSVTAAQKGLRKKLRRVGSKT